MSAQARAMIKRLPDAVRQTVINEVEDLVLPDAVRQTVNNEVGDFVLEQQRFEVACICDPA